MRKFALQRKSPAALETGCAAPFDYCLLAACNASQLLLCSVFLCVTTAEWI